MDKKHYAAMECEDGYVYHDADITANARVQKIMLQAQANQTELGYWRDVATDLAALVDYSEERIVFWNKQAAFWRDKYYRLLDVIKVDHYR